MDSDSSDEETQELTPTSPEDDRPVSPEDDRPASPEDDRPASPEDDRPASPEELNSPPDSDQSDEGECSPQASPKHVNNSPKSPVNCSPIRSPTGSSPKRSKTRSPVRNRSPIGSPIASPASDHKGGSSPKHSDNDGELSDSSSGSRSSSSSSARSNDRPASVDIGHNDGEILNLEAGDKLQSPKTPPGADKVPKTREIIGHGEDLSDVSDLDSNDCSLDLSDDETHETKKDVIPQVKKDILPVEDIEQLDFEAEEVQEKDDKEEGECEGKEEKSDNEGEVLDGDDEGELKGDDLEEGEVSDDDENRPEETEPRPICRFYNRGQCTWGASCRFLHPGVTDKGNYTMFDMVRPLVPVNGPASMYPPIEYRAPYDKPMAFPGGRKDEGPPAESAWERGLRQAKEMMRKSTKRKETDMDFEEKKMNLSIGQEELDKENDYYTRPASPILKDETDRWGSKASEGDVKYYRESPSAGRVDDFPEPGYYPPSRGANWGGAGGGGGGEYSRRVHYDQGGGRASKLRHHRHPIPDYYDEPPPKKTKKHPVREVVVQRVVERPWREERYVEESAPSHRGRGDEWADPWMRSKSPSGRKGGGPRPTRRQSYSSGSSYSSSSTTRSGSSASSYTSYSRSQSRSKSGSGSRSPPIPRNARRKPEPARTATSSAAAQRKARPVETRPPPKGKPTASMLQSEKKAASERLLCMNPPAPSPRKQKDFRPPSPGMMRKSAQNPPPPLPPSSSRGGPSERTKAVIASALVAKAAKLHRRLRPSRSSSSSDSSGSSSDSSDSSYFSSSSSREPTPKAVRPAKRMVIDERERLALAQKVKAMDALKLSGQKPQIKLTLKQTGSNPPAPTKRAGTGLPELPELNIIRRDRPSVPPVASKKRPNDGPLESEASLASKVAALSAKPTNKKATSRREELLKQLKAVEDAIARKRSKN